MSISDEKPNLGALLDAALEDRTLKQQAFTVGLTRTHLEHHLEESPPDFANIGIDEEAKLETAKNETEVMERVVEIRDKWINRLRRVVAVLAVAIVGMLLFSLFGLVIEEAWGNSH